MEWRVKVANEDANNDEDANIQSNKCSNKCPDDKLPNSSIYIKLTVFVVVVFFTIDFFGSINFIDFCPQLVDSTKPE